MIFSHRSCGTGIASIGGSVASCVVVGNVQDEGRNDKPLGTSAFHQLKSKLKVKDLHRLAGGIIENSKSTVEESMHVTSHVPQKSKVTKTNSETLQHSNTKEDKPSKLTSLNENPS